MQEPGFWRERDRQSRASAPVIRMLLTPFADLYTWAGRRRLAKTEPVRVGIPVVCVGNLTVGGVGKTPITVYLRNQLFKKDGRRIATLSRGYGGSLQEPTRVDTETHTAAQVGDEPLMMAQSGESWIGRDRPTAAEAMEHSGVDLIIMDDGFQNPTLEKTLSILVIDSSDPIGNGFVFPKGPLREPVDDGLERADFIILLGDDPVPTEIRGFGGPVLRARIVPSQAPHPAKYVAFAGIGRPTKFFDTLASFPDVEIAEAVPFPDHHVYSDGDLSYLRQLARANVATLITTEKDYVRLPKEKRGKIPTLPVTISFDSPDDEAELRAAIEDHLTKS